MKWSSFLSQVLMLCFHCHGTLACPALCTCHFGPSSTEVVCPHAELSHYPRDGIPNNTTSLTIQFTNLTWINATDLRETVLLQELHMPGNKISSLPDDLLMDMLNLHTIDLTGNLLHELPAKVFHHAPLRNLVLKDNLLSKINPDCLPNNSNLTWLDLSGNKLRKMPSALLQSLHHLENLHLSQNLLEEISAKSLHFLPALVRLHLEENKLNFLEANVFSHNANLTHLFLQRNKLDSLPATVFHDLKHLQYLDLSENRLKFLSPGTLGLGIVQVELTSNPWHCDAKMENMWKRLKMQAVHSQPTCASPEKLKDKVISTLTQKELGLAD